MSLRDWPIKGGGGRRGIHTDRDKDRQKQINRERAYFLNESDNSNIIDLQRKRTTLKTLYRWCNIIYILTLLYPLLPSGDNEQELAFQVARQSGPYIVVIHCRSWADCMPPIVARVPSHQHGQVYVGDLFIWSRAGMLWPLWPSGSVMLLLLLYFSCFVCS